MAQEDTGSGFLVGLSTGLMVGATLAFLFTTPQGKKIRKKVAQEWDKARSSVAHTSGVPEAAEWQWSDVMDKLSYAAHVFMDGVAPAPATVPTKPTSESPEGMQEAAARVTRKSAPTSSRSPEPRTQKFKGV